MSHEPIGVEESTKTQRMIAKLGWTTRPTGDGSNLAVETCPLCQNTNYKFFIAVGGDKDGLFDCKVCGEHGNYYQLRERLGLAADGLVSMKDSASSSQPAAPLPDLEAMHKRLLNDPEMGEVLDYLVAERKFSMAVIEKFKLGADVKVHDGEMVKWYIIPYTDAAGKFIFFKGRSVPPAKKLFRAPTGRETPLFNESILKPGLDEVIIVEGEADALSLLSQGYQNVLGVPGAGMKKAAWLERLDKAAPKTIYLLYDSDKVGQGAARDMAVRIGIERVRNIILPEFQRSDGGVGKDVNEWFCAGHTLEELDTLKTSAKFFDVHGVQSLPDVLQELDKDISEKGTEPKYKTPWPSLDMRMGGAEDGDLIGIMAQGKVGKSTLALNWLQYYVEQGLSCMMFCLEMPPKRMVRKWVSMVTQTDDTPGKSQISSATIQSALAIANQLPGDLLFGYTRVNKVDEVFDTIRQAVRRYGVKVVCFDNLQLLVRSLEHAAQETSKITKAFKQLAMELNIVVLLIVQPHRVPDGQIVAARNAAGSAAIEKDVDTMICLHRNRVGEVKEKDFKGFMDTEDNFEPNMLVRVDLSRYAPGGACTLFFDGPRSIVREFSNEDLTKIGQPSGGGMIPTEEPVAV